MADATESTTPDGNASRSTAERVAENGAEDNTASVAKEHAPGTSDQAEDESQADAFLRNVTASMELAAVFLDPDLRIKHFTPRATEVFELASADLGKSFSRVAGAVDDALYTDARRVMNTGESVRREVQAGADRWFVMRVLPYRTDKEEDLDGVVLRFFDITDRKRAEENLRESEVRLRLLMENLDEYAIFTLDPEGKITSWNAAAAKLFQYAESEALGRIGSILYAAEDRNDDVPQQRLNEARQAGQARDYRWMVRKDGSRFWAYGVTVALYDDENQMRGYARVVRDVSERKRADEKLARAKEESDLAENEAEKARQRAERARAKAERASEAKSQFLANMSHELRTPLNSIIGYSDMILEEVDEEEQETMASDLKRILSSGRHLLDLVNDVLDLSKIEAGQMELDLAEFDVETVVQESADVVRPRIQENGSRLEIECEEGLPRMHADETKLRQSLNNLLSNAAKFTENGTVALRARRERRQDGRGGVTFEVADTGIGMTEEEQQDLFDAFEQASEETSTEYGGTGLGLAITRNVCRLMGGDVELESEKGVGSTFRIWLPEHVERAEKTPTTGMGNSSEAADADATESARTGSAPARPDDEAAGPSEATLTSGSGDTEGAPSAAGRLSDDTVLVVDDDTDVRQMLERRLGNKGFYVETASSGAEGLRKARRLQPLAITLDVRMPDMDGWEVLSLIQEDNRISDDVNVLMLTISEGGQRGYRLGADDFLTKPIDHEKLSAKIEKYRSNVQEGAVLIVEDDEDTRELLQRTLQSDDHAVLSASNGREGLERLGEEEVGLVLLDLMMPKMDGFEFLEALRSDERYRDVPVVVVTAKDLGVEERRYLSEQVDETLKKSEYTRGELLEEVEGRIAAARTAQQHENAGREEAAGERSAVPQETASPSNAPQEPEEDPAPAPDAPSQAAPAPSGGDGEAGDGEAGGGEPSPDRRKEAPTEDGTVLVIDDDDNVRQLLRRRLEAQGFRVEMASSGAEGLRKARRLQPLAVTLDVRMPDMDGWETLGLLRDDDGVSDDTHIVMITVADESEQGYHLGADDFLTKPIERGRLAALLGKYEGDLTEKPVLVVEDDEDARNLLRRTLEREGYGVREASNGREGLERLGEEEVGLVLLDLMMPKMDGFEFLEALRSDERHRDVPVVVVTAKEMEDDERRYLNRQVDETLKKSEYTRAELLEEVEERLVHARTEQRGPTPEETPRTEESASLAETPEGDEAVIAEEVPGDGSGTSSAEADLQAALEESREDIEATRARRGETLAEETANEEEPAGEESLAEESAEATPEQPEAEQSGGPVSSGEEAARPSDGEGDAATRAKPPAEGTPSNAADVGEAPSAEDAGEASGDGEEEAEAAATPAPEENAAEAAGETGDGERDGKPLILLVEDNEHNYNMLSRRLRRRGYEIELATDGQAGLDKAASIHPDLILMDINLPVLDGKEATRRIRQLPEGADVPIIALTAHAMSGDREEALEAGCDRYHSKPVDLPTLLEQIGELM